MEPTSTPPSPLPAGLRASLDQLRARRRFDQGRCIAAKVAIINRYLGRSGVSGCVVGVSGGVDSAVTLGLLRCAADEPGSPIRRLVAVLAPIFSPDGATNQQIALARGREVASAFSAEPVEVDLTTSQRAVKDAVDRGLGIVGDAWSSGQLVSTIRTPALYYVTSLLTQEGDLAVLCGTTNRDEGSYLGFFGKASDGMVDLQVISDLHKSEVYALASRLGVPESVRLALPTGDTYDGRVDEAMIGAPYDFVELYTGLLALEERDPGSRRAHEDRWCSADRAAFTGWAEAVEQLHRHNHHKYISGASAIHLDVYERHVPGGWSRSPETTPPRGEFVGEFDLDEGIVDALDRRTIAATPHLRAQTLADFGESLVEVSGLLAEDEVARLREIILGQAQVAVGRHGVADGYDPARDPPGSGRASAYSPTLAAALWRRLAAALPPVRIFDPRDPDEREGHPVWRPIGLSPLLRGIVYGPGGALVPHYDSSFDLGDGERRTLMSVLIGLGPATRADLNADLRDDLGADLHDLSAGISADRPSLSTTLNAGSSEPLPGADPRGDPSAAAPGCTQFIRDGQRHLPQGERDFQDLPSLAPHRDVLIARGPAPGSALVFDHRLLHQASPWGDERPRVLLRADVVFRRCGPPLPALRPQPQLPLEATIGAPPGASPAEVDRAYAGLSRRCGGGDRGDLTEPVDPSDSSAPHDSSDPNDHTDPSPALAWRVLRDPYYASAYRRLSAVDPKVDITTIRRAGLLDDGSTPDDHRHLARLEDPAWMVTPLHHILRRLAELERAESSGTRERATPVVLVTTGSFCPIHRGHVEMMELARAALESRGMAVLGGYFSVSHDAYVVAKCGPQTPSAAHRLALCEAAVADSEWLMVDPWEALYRDRPVNFTDVLGRLERYLSAHLRLHRAVEVVYVFGSDNADFCLAFAGRGRCVCVPRPGELGALDNLRQHPALAHVSRIILGDRPAPALASTQVRAGDEAGLAPAVQAMWRRATEPSSAETAPLHLFIRDEGRWSVAPWLETRPPAVVLEARERHLQGLCDLLSRSFAAAGQHLEIERRELAEQARSVDAMRQRARVLSLDPCVEGDLNLAVSRGFELAADVSRDHLVARPGAPSIDDQLTSLPDDDLPTILLDDDLVSGRTVEQVQALLGERLSILEVHALCRADATDEPQHQHQHQPQPSQKTVDSERPPQPDPDDRPSRRELCDARDLLPGSRGGGLVVRLPDGALARAPYLLPYVRPSARMQLPLGQELAFSRAVWELSARFFAAIAPPLRLADADPAFCRLADYIGFSDQAKLEDLCRWHAERLPDP